MSKKDLAALAGDLAADRCVDALAVGIDGQQAGALEFADPVLHVLGDIDDHRAGPARRGNLEGGADRRFQLVGSVTRNTCFATEPMIAETGASWKASVPMTPVGTWPQITTIGTESAMESRIGVTVLVAPGPEVTMQTPTRPLARA